MYSGVIDTRLVNDTNNEYIKYKFRTEDVA